NIFQKVKVRARETFDSSATPEVGKRLQPPKKLAEVDLGKLRERISATIERAKADDPELSRHRIADLGRQLRTWPSAAADHQQCARDLADVREKAQQQVRTLEAQYKKIVGQLASRLEKIGALAAAPEQSALVPALDLLTAIRRPVPSAIP